MIAQAGDRGEIDLIVVNDNRGDFTADFGAIGAIGAAARGGERPDLVPPPGCRALTKVRHSVFSATALDYLLGRLHTRTMVMTGQVTEQCILYSARDAYVRHYDVIVPPDAVAHIDAAPGEAALAMMERNMRAQLLPASSCLR